MFQTLYKKCLDLASHRSSNFYLGLVSFIESSFFPIPPDIMIIPMVIAKKKAFIKIFLIASIFSVLGGILGYLIGYLFFDLAMYVIEFYSYEDKVKDLKSFSIVFDKSLLKTVQNLKSPDKRIKNAMNYFVKTGGKRIRPFLIHQTGTFMGIDSKTLNDFALAVECVHLHSLIHDDLPSMDNDDYRRGRLTVHKKFDEATAVLAGDMFQVLSIKTLAESKSY